MSSAVKVCATVIGLLLARINKHWGGHSTLRKLVDDVIPRDEEFTFLDVGSASGDMGRCLREWRPGARVTCLDYIESHLEGCAGSKVAGDAFALPFRERSFDYVFSSLFLHHFTDEQAVEPLAVSRRMLNRRREVHAAESRDNAFSYGV